MRPDEGEILFRLYEEHMPGMCQRGQVSQVVCPNYQKHANPDGAPDMTLDLVKGYYNCPVCQSSGGAVEFVMFTERYDRVSAVDWVEGMLQEEADMGERGDPTPPPPTSEDSELLADLPANDGVYEYHDLKAGTHMVCLRHPWGKQSMDVAPFHWQSGDRQGWINERPQRYCQRWSTPPYNVKELAGAPQRALAFIVSTEREVDAIKDARRADSQFLPRNKAIPLTWMGGDGYWNKTDWSLLRNRAVFMVSRADTTCRVLMERLAMFLVQDHYCPKVHFVTLAKEAQDTDLCTLLARGTPKEVLDSLREQCVELEIEAVPPPVPVRDDPPDPYDADAEGNEPYAPDDIQDADKKEDEMAESIESFVEANLEFEVQGYLGGTQEIIFLRKRGRLSHRVYKRLEQVNKPFLSTLAHFRSWGKASLRYTRITDPVLQAAVSAIDKVATRKGSKNMKDYRGPGATMDGDRVVYHLGDRLLVDGAETQGIVPEVDPPLQNWYELEGNFPYVLPKDDSWRKQAQALAECILRYAWSDPAHAVYCTGWLGQALASGALPWRLNVIMLARSNRGKSWLVNNVLARVLRPMCHQTHDSTQAATSMKAGKTSVPFFVDEMDPNKFKDNIMPMMKASSSNTELKRSRVNTSTNQGVFELSVRTSFFACLAIKPVMTEEFENRIKVISMSNQRLSQGAFDTLANDIDRTLDDGGAERIRDGLVANTHLLVQKEREFANQIAGNGKHADRVVHQRAAIAAGMWFLAGWELDRTIAMLDVEREQVDGRSTNDGLELLAKILTRPIIAEQEVEGRPVKVTKSLLEWMDEDTTVSLHGRRSAGRVAEAFGWKYARMDQDQGAGVYWSMVVSRNSPAHSEMMRAMDRRGLDLVNTLSNLDGVDMLSNARIKFKAKNSCGVLRISPQLLERLDYTVQDDGKVDLGSQDRQVPVRSVPAADYSVPPPVD